MSAFSQKFLTTLIFSVNRLYGAGMVSVPCPFYVRGVLLMLIPDLASIHPVLFKD